MYAQRNGDIRAYSMLTSEAEDILKKIEALRKSTKINSHDVSESATLHFYGQFVIEYPGNFRLITY